MVSIGSIVMNVSDIRRASEFWSRALGYVPREGHEAVLTPSSGEGPHLWLDEEPIPKATCSV
jgi:catechol-2,3-dioxygenase